MAMQPVSNLDNLAQFMQLVSAARSRNGEAAHINSNSATRKAAFAAQAQQANGNRSVVGNGRLDQSGAILNSQKAGSTRHLGTRFDAYA